MIGLATIDRIPNSRKPSPTECEMLLHPSSDVVRER
ncbi:MAG: hypothetical protein QOE71_63 [Pseudonocardiales bacterium]|jgi:hypothetical protein|nr:hypothetical protein [Pseudonocardiales bacterium]